MICAYALAKPIYKFCVSEGRAGAASSMLEYDVIFATSHMNFAACHIPGHPGAPEIINP